MLEAKLRSTSIRLDRIEVEAMMPFPDREEQGATRSNRQVAEGLELGFPDIGLPAALAFHEQGDAGLQGH